jgi:four helix bundle protein
MVRLVLRNSPVAQRVEELAVWRLGNELREKVHAITAHPQISNVFRFCNQTRDAASSITRNIAEGFGRYRHKEFAQFLSIARGSVFELMDQLRDGVSRQYWSTESVAEMTALCNRTISGLTHLIRYLKTHPDV